MSDHTPDALASALPAGISFLVPRNRERWNARQIAQFQAERLAESGYVLLHPEYVDEATVKRLANLVGRGPTGRSAMQYAIPRILAALADTSAQARHTDDDTGGGEDG